MPVLPLGAPPAHSDVLPLEAPQCRSCAAAEGLCDACLRRLLDVRPPWWVTLIGEQHLCERAACDGHLKCLEQPGAATPRTACACHNCGQRRAMRNLVLRTRRAARKSPEAIAHEARRRAARRPKDHPRLAKKTARISALIAGEYAPARRASA